MRPTKLTPAVRGRVLEALRRAHRAVAARAAGISPDTLGEWMERGRERMPDEPEPRRAQSPQFAQFAQEVLEAEAAAEVGVTQELRDQMEEDHRAAMAFLERRIPRAVASSTRLPSRRLQPGQRLLWRTLARPS